MIIRAFSVFEGIVYHCGLIDGSNPASPLLEVDAVIREGDADAGPLLLPVADYITMCGGLAVAQAGIDRFRAADRLVDHLGVAHLAFPFWTPVQVDAPPAPPSGADQRPASPKSDR